MQLFHLLFTRELGGLEQAYLTYTEALLTAGHTPHAVVDPEAPYLPQLQGWGIPITTLSCRGFYDVLAARKLRSLLREKQPQLVMAHNARAMTLARRAFQGLAVYPPIPLVGVAHSAKTHRAEGMDALLTPTRTLAEHFHKEGGYAPENLYVMPNLIALPERLPKPRKHSADRLPVIGAMGRFTQEKGFPVLLEALAWLAERGMVFKLLLAGAGEQEEELRRIVRRHGLGQQVEFVGWIEDKDAFFDQLDIFCLPSLSESFGLVILEAWARGIPVVASDADGPAELITKDENGLIVARDDKAAMASALRKLMESPELADRIGEAGQYSVREYSFREGVVRLDAIVRRIAGMREQVTAEKEEEDAV